METNIILAGVGGQGILSVSFVIDTAALIGGLQFKQSEVHGMSQRGGDVTSHLRISDGPIYSDLVPKGRGDLILSVEPLESLRYLEYLSPNGVVITTVDPYKNIPDYIDLDELLGTIAELPHHILLPAERLARRYAGTPKAQNMVLLGAASPYLHIKQELLEEGIKQAFARKGEKLQNANVAAFRAGMNAGKAYVALLKQEVPSRPARALAGRLLNGKLDDEAVQAWAQVLKSAKGIELVELFESKHKGDVEGTRQHAEKAAEISATQFGDLLR